LDHAGKGRAPIVAAHGQAIGSEKHETVSFDRADRYAGWIAPADVEIAIAEELQPSVAAKGIFEKLNRTT